MSRSADPRSNLIELAFFHAQVGLTLVELMISMALGLFIVLATTALFVSTKSTYLVQDDDARIQETGRYALDIIARSIRTASSENWDVPAYAADGKMMEASIAGLDARSLKSRTPGIESPSATSVNGSDVLALHQPGAGSGDAGDGTMLNCAGFGIPGSGTMNNADGRRGWSIFYVAEDASGEPELYCKYRGDHAWTAQVIARGVESFQVLYGIDLDADGLPDQFLNATAINALDDAIPTQGANKAEVASERRSKTHWKKVAAVKIALLIRGSSNARGGKSADQYDLFGKAYADAYAGTDTGVRLRESGFSKAVQGRLRHIFSLTVVLPGVPTRRNIT